MKRNNKLEKDLFNWNFLILENKSFFSELFNINSSKPLLNNELELEIISLNLDNIQTWEYLQNKFESKFSLNTCNLLFHFLKNYFEYYVQEQDYSKEMELMKQYWLFINSIRYEDKDFNYYLIFINVNLYNSQKGFKRMKG